MPQRPRSKGTRQRRWNLASEPPLETTEAARVAAYAPVIGRVLLGLVFAWFGYHELVQPHLWTGYVPMISSTSTLALAAVLAHGWVLLVVAAALVLGIAPRLAAGIGVLVMLEVVLALVAAHGLSDVSMRDVGVLGLALALAGQRHQRLALTK
jgi:uncharacterized membrane protein YphA (DoxX/SURF4 family)